MPDLKLIALDPDDLAVVSAHLQDAVLRVGDMAFLKREKRFVAVANRFDWAHAIAHAPEGAERFERRRTGVRFEHVLGAEVQGFDVKAADRVLSLLAISFQPTNAPEGHIMLHFSGGLAVRLHVECVEVGLDDLGAAWSTPSMPRHEV
jgi:hypothetical protein